jgi:antitoxin MazE
MITQVIRIGNARGICIPESIIERCGFGEAVDLRVENSRLVVSARRKPRQGWARAFRAASAHLDECKVDSFAPNEFDAKEWQW